MSGTSPSQTWKNLEEFHRWLIHDCVEVHQAVGNVAGVLIEFVVEIPQHRTKCKI